MTLFQKFFVKLKVFRVIIEDQCRNVRLLDERRNAEKGKRLEKEKRRSKGKGKCSKFKSFKFLRIII